MRMIFLSFVAVLAQATVATATPQDPAFSADKWEVYDGSERLGLMQEKCGEGWPRGYTARQAMGILKGISKADGEKLMQSCDPKELASKPAPSQKADRAKPQTLDVVRPELQRVEHPFKTIPKNKQYRCWIDASGRHRVADDDPAGTGWCFGPAVGDRGA